MDIHLLLVFIPKYFKVNLMYLFIKLQFSATSVGNFRSQHGSVYSITPHMDISSSST